MIKFLSAKEAFTPRIGETRLGEIAYFLKSDQDVKDQLKDTSIEFVLLGLAEDKGVEQNAGIKGTSKTPIRSIQAVLNTQVLDRSKDRLIVLGILEAHDTVSEMDASLTHWINLIKSNGKTPIVLGGGHNNAYGNIKGLSQACQEAVGVINIDAHTDFRRLEHRHSGNGFSYAYSEGFLKRYFMLGIQNFYTPLEIHESISNNSDLDMISYDDLLDGSITKEHALNRAVDHIKNCRFTGLEIDLDVIAFMPSSAMSPSGFQLDEVRYFTKKLSQSINFSYLHICEGIAEESAPIYARNLAPKATAYLVRDFMRMANSDQKE